MKTRQQMILTETSSAASDKVAMGIMETLTLTKAGYNYILTVQDLLTKFLVAIPLEQITVIHIADIFIRNFICILVLPRANESF